MEDEINTSEISRILKANWWLAFLIFLLVMGGVLAYAFLTEPIYEAHSTLVVRGQDQTAILLGQASSKIDLETQKEIIMSSSVLGTVQRSIPADSFDVNVRSIRNSNVIEITVRSVEPGIAMSAANQIADATVDYSRRTRIEEARAVIDFINEQAAQYEQELNSLSNQIDQHKNIDNPTSEEALKLNSLQREYTAKERLYTNLLQKKEDASIAVNERSGTVTVIEYAPLPFRPVSPDIPLSIIIGFIVATGLAISAVFLREQLRATFSNASQIESELNTSLLGSLPLIRKPSADLLSQHAGSFRESMLNLTTNIRFYIEDNHIKILSIHSPTKGEGKSLVAANLAVALAHTQKKVLVVDLNLRNPAMHKAFKTEDGPGVAEVVLKEGRLPEHVKKTSHPNIFLMPAGKNRQAPLEIISSNRMKDVFSKLKNSAFDIVILDSPSFEKAEASVIATNSQASILVLSIQKTTRDKARDAKQRFAKLKATLMGIVVNEVED